MACERLLRGRCVASVDPSNVMFPLALLRPGTCPPALFDLDARRPFARNSETLFMIIVPPTPVIPRLRSPPSAGCGAAASTPPLLREDGPACVPHFGLLIVGSAAL